MVLERDGERMDRLDGMVLGRTRAEQRTLEVVEELTRRADQYLQLHPHPPPTSVSGAA